MKKVLIITYYWPPSGGAGVQRWLRFVKNLRKFGWEPIIYTAKDPLYPVFDEKLLDEIPEGVRTLKLPVREPNNLIGKLFFWKKDRSEVIYKNQQQKGKRSLMQKFLWFIRGNFFIPDARLLWIKPSARFLQAELPKGEYDLVISTGPPHSLHLIAKRLKEKLGVPWVADFRDPWTSMDYLQEMFLTNMARRKHMRLEKSVVQGADKVIVVGRTMYNEFVANHNTESAVIHNGYNEYSQPAGDISRDEKFTIVHIGSFLKNRNCDDLWEVLSEQTKADTTFAEKLEIKLIGKVAGNVMESLEKYGLMPYLNKIDYVQYEKTLDYLFAAQVLFLPIDRIENAEFVITGKLFEYLKARRPILVIGPLKGDAADIVTNCNAGYCCEFDDKAAIKDSVLTMYQAYLQGKNDIQPVNIEQYSGYELTKKLVGYLDEIVPGAHADASTQPKKQI